MNRLVLFLCLIIVFQSSCTEFENNMSSGNLKVEGNEHYDNVKISFRLVDYSKSCDTVSLKIRFDDSVVLSCKSFSEYRHQHNLELVDIPTGHHLVTVSTADDNFQTTEEINIPDSLGTFWLFVDYYNVPSPKKQKEFFMQKFERTNDLRGNPLSIDSLSKFSESLTDSNLIEPNFKLTLSPPIPFDVIIM
jgi:hypothetical protein